METPSSRSVSAWYASALVAALLGPMVAAVPADARDVDSASVSTFAASAKAGATVGFDLVRPDGTPARRARAVLYAWPDARALERMKLGDEVTLVPVGTATSDARGHVDVRIARSDVVRRRANAQGMANLELIATDGSHSYSRTFPVAVSDSRDADHITAVIDGSRRVLADGPLTLPRAPQRVSGCTSKFVKDLGMRNVTVAYAYTVPGAATVEFVYKEGATSVLGVAGSVSGKYGTFTASGTTSTTANAEQSFPKTSGNKELITKFRYGMWKVQCSGYPHGNFVKHTVAPKNFEGGSIERKVKGPPAARHCVPQEKKASYRKSDTAAYENGVGASLSSVIGIDLSARTGYSKTASLHFVWKRAGQLCGTNASPGRNPKLLVAK